MKLKEVKILSIKASFLAIVLRGKTMFVMLFLRLVKELVS